VNGMNIWIESEHNYWTDDKGKYGLKITSRGNWWLEVEDVKNRRKIVSVYLALRTEEEARGYMDFLLFVNQDADALIANLKDISKR